MSLLSGCSSLKTIDLSPLSKMVKVESLYSLVSACSNLTSVDLSPLSGMVEVTDLSYFLYGCERLTSIDLRPLSGMIKVTDLSDLLCNCTKLKYILIANTTPWPISTYTFYNTNSCPIYVPDELVETYKTATNWIYQSSRIKPMSDFSTDFPDI